jgi:hypothetical protein
MLKSQFQVVPDHRKIPRPIPPRSPEGYAHRARSHAPSGQGVWPTLTLRRLWPEARGLLRALGTRSTAPLCPAFGSSPATDASQGPGTRRQALRLPMPGGSPVTLPRCTLPAGPPIGSCPGRDTRRQSSPAAFGGWRASGPTCQPLEPTSLATRKTPEGLTQGRPV